MSYYGPEVYNVENLNDKDKDAVKYWKRAVEDMLEAEADEYHRYDATVIGKMRREVCDEVIDELREKFNCLITELCVAFIESYDDVEIDDTGRLVKSK